MVPAPAPVARVPLVQSVAVPVHAVAMTASLPEFQLSSAGQREAALAQAACAPVFAHLHRILPARYAAPVRVFELVSEDHPEAGVGNTLGFFLHARANRIPTQSPHTRLRRVSNPSSRAIPDPRAPAPTQPLRLGLATGRAAYFTRGAGRFNPGRFLGGAHPAVDWASAPPAPTSGLLEVLVTNREAGFFTPDGRRIGNATTLLELLTSALAEAARHVRVVLPGRHGDALLRPGDERRNEAWLRAIAWTTDQDELAKLPHGEWLEARPAPVKRVTTAGRGC